LWELAAATTRISETIMPAMIANRMKNPPQQPFMLTLRGIGCASATGITQSAIEDSGDMENKLYGAEDTHANVKADRGGI